jgi:hypothetical protein
MACEQRFVESAVFDEAIKSSTLIEMICEDGGCRWVERDRLKIGEN